jgi:hypothetical protein
MTAYAGKRAVRWQDYKVLVGMDNALRSGPGSGSNFQLFPDSELPPILRLSKEKLAVLFVARSRRVPFTLTGML